jgi:alpha-ketoglutaric semialdehyde dehydrogenase
MHLHGKSIVAGRPVPASDKLFRAVDPATGEELEPAFHEAGTEVAVQAMDAAAAAFVEYSRCTPDARAEFLDAIATAIEALGDALIERACAETGLPAARIMGERGRTCGQLHAFATLVREGSWVDARIDTALPERKPQPRPDIRRMLKPIGPVVVFGASNFPLAFSTAGGDTASALAAGCPVVVKAHEAHPGTGELVARAIANAAERCGLPPGAFSMVHGDGRTVGLALIRHPATAAVAFTGSQRAGRALFDAAAARPRPVPVFAEMSSVNPVYLLPRALAERPAAIAEALLGSFTLGVGQFCTKPGLVFAVRGPSTDAFLERLAGAVDRSAPGTMLSRGVHAAFERGLEQATAVDGVRVLAAAPRATATTQAAPSVATTDAKNLLAHPALATEVFGPFALVVVADDMSEIVACTNALDGQLTATFHATDADLAEAGTLLEAAERIAGRLIVNGFPTGVEVSPAMHHGGPYPATTDVRFTSVGTAAILRFARPVCYQGFAAAQLPLELRNENERGILRTVNGELTRQRL